jgi:lysyl endopeptidase
MRTSCSRLLAAAALLALAISPATASVDDFQWDVQVQPETVGSPRDPADHAAGMRQLQERLTARQVERGLRSPLAVGLSAAERQSVNDLGRREMKYFVGVAKPIGIQVDFAAARGLGAGVADLAMGTLRGNGDGGFVWTAAVASADATALRLHIKGLDLPAGAALYVYNRQGHAFGPYTRRGPLGTGELHTNTVFGGELLIQLQSDGRRPVPAFEIAQVGVMGERFRAARYSPEGRPGPAAEAFCAGVNASCVQNAACQSSGAVSTAKDAVAGMLFQSGGGYYICTGGLLADTVTTSVIPYFLTANHCIGSSGEASSLETFFDYETTCSNPDCDQSVYNTTGHTIGATILSTSSTSDYTLMRLASTPVTPDGTTTYLGWNTTAVANSNGVGLYRISHPGGSPQAYSEHTVDTSKGTCRSWPRGNWIYSRDTYGATEGGSSGSPVVNGSGQVVGQLSGGCGTNVTDECDSQSNATVDGAFAAYYSKVSQWLSPGGGGGSCSPKGAACTSDSACCSGNCGGKPGAQTCK